MKEEKTKGRLIEALATLSREDKVLGYSEDTRNALIALATMAVEDKDLDRPEEIAACFALMGANTKFSWIPARLGDVPVGFLGKDGIEQTPKLLKKMSAADMELIEHGFNRMGFEKVDFAAHPNMHNWTQIAFLFAKRAALEAVVFANKKTEDGQKVEIFDKTKTIENLDKLAPVTRVKKVFSAVMAVLEK